VLQCCSMCRKIKKVQQKVAFCGCVSQGSNETVALVIIEEREEARSSVKIEEIGGLMF